jgi:transposase, IS30 family
MTYHQITCGERYLIASLRALGARPAAIARELGRHPSTIVRELWRNRNCEDRYRAQPAHGQAMARRSHSRRNRRLAAADWRQVVGRLRAQWSPEQIAGWGRATGAVRISHETIYRHVAMDRHAGGVLHRYLRGARKLRRRRAGSARRGTGLLGPSIARRPASVQRRRRIGHWEVDTVLGRGSRDCILTLVERKTGYVVIGKLPNRTADAFAQRATQLIRAQPRAVRTITADNGTELSGYRAIERRTQSRFFFATPYHAWERGTNENTNGLIRQYLPKGQSMAGLTQRDCANIARQLNQRPRKRLGYRTPEECYER